MQIGRAHSSLVPMVVEQTSRGERSFDIYSRHTGRTPEEVHEDMERDRFFGAEEAVDYGLVDRIVTASELHRPPSGFAAAVSGSE